MTELQGLLTTIAVITSPTARRAAEPRRSVPGTACHGVRAACVTRRPARTRPPAAAPAPAVRAVVIVIVTVTARPPPSGTGGSCARPRDSIDSCAARAGARAVA